MAIRDDFTAGEVLAAADLNDTFASKVPYAYGTATPSTTVDGFVWYDENETPPAPKFWDGAAFQAISAPSGLVHIATQSFSAVSSVSLNGVFTSAYENYRVTVNASLGSSSTLQLRWRVSGSDDSAANYQQQYIIGRSSTASAEVDSASTYAQLTRANAAGSHIYSGDIYSPNLSANTVTLGLSHNLFPENTSNRTYFNATTVFDGLTLFPGSGTFTGTIRVYGYANS